MNGQLPRDILLVEDNLIIALDSQETLISLGVPTARVASNAAQALAEIEKQKPDFVLLDVRLCKKSNYAIAETLIGEGIAYAFVKGYGEKAALPEKLSSAPIIGKPYSKEDILAALTPGRNAVPAK